MVSNPNNHFSKWSKKVIVALINGYEQDQNDSEHVCKHSKHDCIHHIGALIWWKATSPQQELVYCILINPLLHSRAVGSLTVLSNYSMGKDIKQTIFGFLEAAHS